MENSQKSAKGPNDSPVKDSTTSRAKPPVKSSDKPTVVDTTKKPAEGSNKNSIKVLDKYITKVRNITIYVTILTGEKEYTPLYAVNIAGLSKTTEILLEEIREELIRTMDVEHLDVDDETGDVDAIFDAEMTRLLKLYFTYDHDDTLEILRSYLISRALGRGYIDFLLQDQHLEEIVIDNAKEPFWVYHRKWGWLKTNVFMSSEDQIQQAASRIGRQVGRQINTLHPLLDAYLPTGERVNATISPITPRGNTITVRKFSEDPWTITKFIENKTISSEAASVIWQAMHYEMSILVVGGTASGKTSMLNALANFVPPNQRVISIEDTRELRLASFLYWVPMLTRFPNNEGKGGISMEDLLVNSLRMRPDRILVGEVRRKAEAETMFEAIHTGHSCYGTFHANDAREAIARLTNDPVSVPKALLPAINLMLVQFRNRRTGQRKTFQLAEVLDDNKYNLLYQYDAGKDVLNKDQDSVRLAKDLTLFTGMDKNKLIADLKERKEILDLMVKKKIFNVEEVGKVMAQYYNNKEEFLKKFK